MAGKEQAGVLTHTAQTHRVTWAALARTACVAIALVFFTSCNKAVRSGRSSTQFVIELLEATAGGGEPAFSGQLQSDVSAGVDGSVFSDIGRVAGRLAFKDPGTSENPASPTSANWITITRYRVEFERGDGRNTPGVDVPHPFDGGATFTVIEVITFQFLLVRAQAKLEPPLRALRSLGGAVSIATVAKVTFFGHDQTGAAVSATGRISVTFADYSD